MQRRLHRDPRDLGAAATRRGRGWAFAALPRLDNVTASAATRRPATTRSGLVPLYNPHSAQAPASRTALRLCEGQVHDFAGDRPRFSLRDLEHRSRLEEAASQYGEREGTGQSGRENSRSHRTGFRSFKADFGAR